MKMNNVFDKKYSEIIDNTKSVDLTKELENRLRTKAQEELIKTLEEKDKKLLKLANETNSKEAPYSHAPSSINFLFSSFFLLRSSIESKIDLNNPGGSTPITLSFRCFS
jgi:hypothetical protein